RGRCGRPTPPRSARLTRTPRHPLPGLLTRAEFLAAHHQPNLPLLPEPGGTERDVDRLGRRDGLLEEDHVRGRLVGPQALPGAGQNLTPPLTPTHRDSSGDRASWYLLPRSSVATAPSASGETSMIFVGSSCLMSST